MREDHSMCHEAGCSLAHIPYQIASCGCLHADWMVRATTAEAIADDVHQALWAAEAEIARLRTAVLDLADNITDWDGVDGMTECVIDAARTAIEENQHGQG